MDIITIAIWILLGAVSGWVASEIMESKYGTIPNIFLGILGSFLGSWLASLLGVSGVAVGVLSIISVITAVMVAGALVFTVEYFKKA